MSADLVAFLRARIAEDRRLAEAVPSTFPSPWASTNDSLTAANGREIVFSETAGGAFVRGEAGPHIARWDPARVLAECDAKEALLDLYENAEQIYKPVPQLRAAWGAYLAAVKLLAQPYADRSGFDDDWRTPLIEPSTQVETVNGVVDFGSPIIHIARQFRRSLCGDGILRNILPVGAVRLDDPHLCSDCKQMRETT